MRGRRYRCSSHTRLGIRERKQSGRDIRAHLQIGQLALLSVLQCGPTDKAHIYRDEQHNWLCEQDPHGATDVPYDQLLEINFDFFLLGMDSPVFRASPQLACLVNQHYGWVRLFQEQQ